MSLEKWHAKSEISPNVLKIITKIKNVKKRNLLRGYSGKVHLNPKEISSLRSDNGLQDCYFIGAALKGKGGLLNKEVQSKRKTSKSFFSLTSFPALSWKEEICYTVGYVNASLNNALDALDLIKALLRIDKDSATQSLETILSYSELNGASNLLSFKLAYLRSAKELNSDELNIVTKIEEQFNHRDGASFHFSALENLNSRVSLFVAARRRVSALAGRVKGDIRKAIAISNFIPTPVSIQDLPSFLLRATESSLLDTMHSIIIIFNLNEEFKLPREEFIKKLDPKITSKIFEIIEIASKLDNNEVVTEYYSSLNEEGDGSLDLYRNSAAFLERPLLVDYRNRFDKVIVAFCPLQMNLSSRLQDMLFHLIASLL